MKTISDFKDLDEFTQAYIITALWSSNDESTPSGGEPLDKNYTWRDIAPETFERMIADCEKFQAEQSNVMSDAIESGEVVYGPDFGPYGRAGHDFWLTRNGHGAGFWDGDWPETAGEALTKASKAFGELSLYVGDDGRIYV